MKKRKEVYRVAVHYPKGWEKYGGVSEYPTKEAALAARENLLLMNHKEVHVWRVTEEMIQE